MTHDTLPFKFINSLIIQMISLYWIERQLLT